MSDPNWDSLVEEYEPQIGKLFRDHVSGEVLRFFGLVHTDDDFCFGLYSVKGYRLVLGTCVTDLRGNGFEPVDEEPSE